MPVAPRVPRPVYILGAGFSKAIHGSMPITNALGEEIHRRLAGQVDINLRDGQTFEAWLTAMLDPMPFLTQAEVLARRSAAALVTQTIAEILDEAQAEATADPAPDWLLQLVRLWHAERAVVITFNYDCLVERAINTALIPVGYATEQVIPLVGADTASPAPPRQESVYFQDGNSNLLFESITLVKLHGSLNWYRADGDGFGSTLVQAFDTAKFGGRVKDLPRGNPELIAHMDRFIIPPVSDKSQHYGAYIVPALWKTARDAISVATRVTFMGYSLPAEDRVSVELMTYCPPNAPVVIADRATFEVTDPATLPNRLVALGLTVADQIPGDKAIAKVMTRLVYAASAQMQVGVNSSTPRPAYDCYVGWGDASLHQESHYSGFRLLLTDDGDPSLVRAVPVAARDVLHDRVAFKTRIEGDLETRGIDPTKLLTESGLRSILSQGKGLRIDPDDGSILRTVVGAQHIVGQRGEDGDFLALHTIEGG